MDGEEGQRVCPTQKQVAVRQLPAMVWVAGAVREKAGTGWPLPPQKGELREMLDGVGVAPGDPWVAETPGSLQSFGKIAAPPHREGNSLPCRGGQTGARLAELRAGGKEVASLACGRGGMGQEGRWGTLIWASLNSEPGEQAVTGLQRVRCYFLAVTDTLVNISLFLSLYYMSMRVVLVVKKLPANAGDVRDVGWIPGSGRSPGGGHGNPLQLPCLENPTDRGAWWATIR